MVASSLAIPLAAALGEDGNRGTGGFLASLVAIVAAALAGVGVSACSPSFAIRYIVDQVIVGVVLNVLVVGLTGFLYSELLLPNEAVLNSPPIMSRTADPGPQPDPDHRAGALQRQTFIMYLMYIAVPAVWFALYKTRWGLRVRAVGEHPKAADTVGINVNRTPLLDGAARRRRGGRGWRVLHARLGRLVQQGGDERAAGFIALAAVIFGRWDPIRATLAALLFGFATNLQ